MYVLNPVSFSKTRHTLNNVYGFINIFNKGHSLITYLKAQIFELTDKEKVILKEINIVNCIIAC